MTAQENQNADHSASYSQSLMLWAAPILSALVGWSVWKFGGLETPEAITLGIALWTALWWIFEAVPIPVASLLPLSLLPLFGILEPKVVGEKYGHPLVLLLLGGFLLSKAMEKSGAHRRIALMMVNACPPGEKFLILGFMAATAFLSMWISNTATTLMMLPMALAVIQNSRSEALKIPLLLGIAFAANVGGIGTPIGTPPNLVMLGAYKDLGHPEISFTEWMKFGVPVTITMVLVIWLWLSRGITGKERIALPDPGTWRKPEVRTLLVFGLTALAWITRSEPFGGWKTWLDLPQANDASVAFVAVIFLFCLPGGEKKGERLLDWKTANKIPWGMLVLVGAGLCLGEGFKQSGLSATIAGVFTGIESLPLLGLLLGIALLVTFMTEMTSNTATTNVLMPILGAAAVASDLDPKLLMIPAAISASCAFMLPVATIPNAVVFGTGEVTVRRMAREGLVLNLIGALVVSGICYLLLS
ncbi:MAG: SLC13/DASS family transporter [Opitutae bacterium]|nr:SLC13/DASS family transporter [Opitutae bacterium]